MKIVDIQYSPIIRRAGLVLELTRDEYSILNRIAHRIGCKSVREVIIEAIRLYIGKHIDKIIDEVKLQKSK